MHSQPQLARLDTRDTHTHTHTHTHTRARTRRRVGARRRLCTTRTARSRSARRCCAWAAARLAAPSRRTVSAGAVEYGRSTHRSGCGRRRRQARAMRWRRDCTVGCLVWLGGRINDLVSAPPAAVDLGIAALGIFGCGRARNPTRVRARDRAHSFEQCVTNSFEQLRDRKAAAALPFAHEHIRAGWVLTQSDSVPAASALLSHALSLCCSRAINAPSTL